MMKMITVFLIIVGFFSFVNAQPTVGLLTYQPEKSLDGYNLIYPHEQPNIYLIDNCGQIVHQWLDDADFRPSETAYLLENGNVVKCKSPALSITDVFFAGGGGAFIEIRNWENDLLWSFEQNNETQRLHHDIEILPNGNILAISWELKTAEEAIANGRDPDKLFEEVLWPDYILEINPTSNEIVWEWHAWDHLIQDFDPQKSNYGVIADHPELIDLNWDIINGREDWMHSNAIDYNQELDQILLTVATFSEVWVIDHSTTKEEAAGHTGGLANKGGDLLYRWGNPATYKSGSASDQQLFYPHDIHWIDTGVDESNPQYGKLAVFNNRPFPDYSTTHIWDASFDTTTWSYPMIDEVFGPTEFDWTFTHPEPTKLNSRIASSMQVLENENILICSGRVGYVFEATPNNEIVWEYKIPFRNGFPVTQGTALVDNDNVTFRVERYATDYPAFDNRDLSPQGLIELDGNPDYCDQLVNTPEVVLEPAILILPNPANDYLSLDNLQDQPIDIFIYNFLGQAIQQFTLNGGEQKILDLSNWKNGVYLVEINQRMTKKIIVAH